MRWICLVAVAVCSSGCLVRSVLKDAELPEGGREVRDVAYYQGPDFDGEKHKLNLYVPPGPGKKPVLVFVHGGGWVFGDRKIPFDGYGKLGKRFAQRGFLTAVISYRLAPKYAHPAQVKDVAAALKWVFEHAAEYGGDPAQVYAMGQSAGAHLVALVATDPRWLREQGLEPSALAGVIAVSGPYEVRRLGSSLFLGGLIVHQTFGKDPAAWDDASPARHLGEAPLPPFYLAYADADFPMLRDYARTFARQLRQHGAQVRLDELPFKDHFTEIADAGEDADALAAGIEAFVRPAQTRR